MESRSKLGKYTVGEGSAVTWVKMRHMNSSCECGDPKKESREGSEACTATGKNSEKKLFKNLKH